MFDNGYQGTLLGGIITRNMLVTVSHKAATLTRLHLARSTWTPALPGPGLARRLSAALLLTPIGCVCCAVLCCAALQYDKEKNRAGFADTDCNAIKPAAQVRLQLGPALQHLVPRVLESMLLTHRKCQNM
jgi:hypothetical protein